MSLSNNVIGFNELPHSYQLQVVGDSDVYSLVVSQPNAGDVELTIENMTAEDQYAISTIAAIAGAPGPPGPQGPEGEPGPAGSDGQGLRYFTYQVTNANAIWLIPHNLGTIPHVDILDLDGSVVVAAVKYLDINTVEIDFGVPFSGSAVLRG
jgi:hypothetical protein